VDLAPYTCRGFHGDFDRLMADVPVAGIDRAQADSMVRLCPETDALLYGSAFSSRRIRYAQGSRPLLEKIVAPLQGPAGARAWRALEWTRSIVVHPHFLAGDLRPDRGMAEEDLIASGRGWCNEQVRVFVALCEVMEVPARICFLFHADGRTAHVASEALVDGRWAFHDVTYGVRVELPDGRLAEARELRASFRDRADAAYRPRMVEYYARANPVVKRLDVERGGDLFAGVGLCNYLIGGARSVGG
jgi:hypothetical protein